jgi:hypothetical protein
MILPPFCSSECGRPGDFVYGDHPPWTGEHEIEIPQLEQGRRKKTLQSGTYVLYTYEWE